MTRAKKKNPGAAAPQAAPVLARLATLAVEWDNVAAVVESEQPHTASDFRFCAKALREVLRSARPARSTKKPSTTKGG